MKQGMRTVIVLILLTSFTVACVAQAPNPTASPTTSPSPVAISTPPPTAPATPSAQPAAGFYLRAWFEQALPPDTIFSQLPMLTISEGVAIDGNIAIPAIYPGPIYVTPFARTISADGQAQIEDEARRLGLIGEQTDFTGGGVAPGAQIARLLMVIDGTTYDLSGLPDLAIGDEPGSPQAFAAFWGELSMLDSWLGSELGSSEPYVPERVAVLFTGPVPPEPGLPQQARQWPLPGSFDEMGVDFPGAAGARCLTISGDDLEVVLPVLEQATLLTVFLDDDDGQASASAVVVVPGEESPCGE